MLSFDWSSVPLRPLEEPLLEMGEDAGYEDEHGEWIDDSLPVGYSSETNEEEFRKQLNKALRFAPGWLTFQDGTVRLLAEKMLQTGDYDLMPILADALLQAGCENELILWHCRSPAGVHARGSWLVELICNADPEARLQGEWEAVRGEAGGKPTVLQGYSYTFTNGRFTAVSPDRTVEGQYTLEPTRTPMRITFVGYGVGIIHFQSNQLRMCVAPQKRPKSFSTSDKPAVLTVCQREQ